MNELLVDVREAGRRLGLSRTEIFALLRRDELESVLIGERRRRIPVDALERYVERLRAEQAPSPEPIRAKTRAVKSRRNGKR